MAKREKVLIVLMVAAIGFGAFEIFIRPAVKAPVQERNMGREEATKLSTTISQTIQKSELVEVERYFLQAAVSEWVKDPFYVWPEPRYTDMAPGKETTEKPGESAKSFVYSGYLEMGRTRIAVLNGIEYLAGEITQDEEFLVLNITPERVTLRSKKSGREVVIPHEDAFFVE
jgi:hypothetical protein